jgi:hypothetical protein
MGEIATTAVYTLVFGLILGLGVLWWRHPERLEDFMRGTVFDAWSRWMVPWMAWGFMVLGAVALGIQPWGWLD